MTTNFISMYAYLKFKISFYSHENGLQTCYSNTPEKAYKCSFSNNPDFKSFEKLKVNPPIGGCPVPLRPSRESTIKNFCRGAQK